MEPNLKEIDKKLDKIWMALTGDDQLGIRGINHKISETQHQVNDHEKRLTKVEETQKKSKWMRIGASIASGATGLGSGLAIGSGKASAVISKVAVAAGSILFVMYLLMLVL